jgi:hypothetical protein
LGIKSTEYYSKAVHYTFWVKDEAFPKYAPLIPKDMFVGLMPTEQVHELRGHYHGETPTSYLFIPDKVFVTQQDKIFGGETGTPAKAETAEDEEKPFEVQKADLVRATNFLPACDTFTALYFTITGLHALHIIGGMIVMSYFWGPGASLYRRNPEHMANRIEVFGIFWHFVDLVWISAFPILYLF